MKHSRYSIGIDLGTTNSSLAYIDKSSRKAAIKFLSIQQVSAEGEIRSDVLLPSYLYLPGEFEAAPEAMALPWDRSRKFAAGEFARKQAARIAGRVVSSAKSWLCHKKVDRTAKILPWGSRDLESAVSPVEASARYLSHLREAWNYTIAKGSEELLLENQEIVLTVPASFDAVARELTVEAARGAGLPEIVLLEEPQAAFYSWLFSHETSWRKALKDISLILIIDVGGGTTDLSLIEVVRSEAGLSLKRIAVGEHLMLGGDNIDLALARVVEEEYIEGDRKLDSQRWSLLAQECRGVKEKALEGEGAERFPITLPGRGSRIIGEAIQAEISREEVLNVVMEGFFPEVCFDEKVINSPGVGFREWGLPYAQDPAITRHIAAFLKTHLKGLPDALLFNGGALKSDRIQSRLANIIEHWHRDAGKEETSLKILANRNLDLAVSRGAAYFGIVRQGEGIRIGGGIPRSYYVGIDIEKQKGQDQEGLLTLLCLIPKDLPTEREVEIKDREFSLLLGCPVSFPLYSSTIREGDAAGQVLSLPREEIEALPPLFMVLESQSGRALTPVHLSAWVTEIGTLELWCVSRNNEDRWKLQFALNKVIDDRILPRGASEIDRGLLNQARELIVTTFTRKPGRITSDDIKPGGIMTALENLFHQKREQWSTAYNREVVDGALQVAGRRRSNPIYESGWLNMAGWGLRPGFGYPLDEWRIGELWDIFPAWLQFNKDPQCRIEWWVMWRRVAGGLRESEQEEIFTRISPYFFPGRKHIRSFSGPLPNRVEAAEILRMSASLERISISNKKLLGEYILEHYGNRQDQLFFWLIARIGSRMPFAGSIHSVLDRDTAQEWIRQILDMKWKDSRHPAFALVKMSRLTGDRERDIDEELRLQVQSRLLQEKMPEDIVKPLMEVIEEEAADQSLIFGESLPAGLILKTR